MVSVDRTTAVPWSDELPAHACGPCQYGGQEVKVVKFCGACQEFLFQNCIDSHKNFKNPRDHKIIATVTDKSKDAGARCLVRCDCGQNTEATHYCEDHCTVLCGTCRAVKYRRCDIELIKANGLSYDETKLTSLVKRTEYIVGNTGKLLNDRMIDFESD